ncbi:SNF2 superfamily chromatin remodeling protein [Mycena galericulata]|nr:SNF2 superfamily chromatin remodeling protein [Mycena galericulata]
MTSRLDRLLLLLDTGSSSSVRNTAAKQLAQLAAKSVISDVALEEDLKNSRQHVSKGDPEAWAELMSVVARIIPFLHSKSFDTRTAASVALSQIFSLVPLWQPETMPPPIEEQSFPAPSFPHFSVQELISQGKLLLASSGKEFIKPAGILASAAEVKKARKAAMSRLGLDFLDEDDLEIEKELAEEMDVDIEGELDSAPVPLTVKVEDEADPDTAPSFSPMDVEPKAKRETTSAPTTRSATPADPSPTTPNTPDTEAAGTAGLSARELNRLKRKRKPNNSAFVAPPPQSAGAKFTPAAVGNSHKARLVAADDAKAPAASRLGTPTTSEKVIIDPSKGGAVSPKAAAQSRALDVLPGTWIWDGVVRVLEVDLFSAAWEVRHGAAMALRELLKVQGACGGMRDDTTPIENAAAHEKWCNDLSAKFLCVFVLDRFGDFVSDQVVAPVRETVSQTLASLLLHMPRRSVAHVHAILLQMIQQEHLPPAVAVSNGAAKPRRGKVKAGAGAGAGDAEKTHVWEVRHAGLLGIKYEVAVRSDLFATKRRAKVEAVADAMVVDAEGDVKREDDRESLKLKEGDSAIKCEEMVKREEETGNDFDETGKEVLRGVVEAAILGLGDRDDDVRSVAASCLLPVAEHLVEQLPEALDRVLVVLWHCLSDMKDDLSSSVGAVMDLLGKLVSYDKVIAILADETVALPLTALAPTLFPFFRHTIPNVRLAVVKTLSSFMAVPTLPRDWIAAPFLQLLFQNLIVEERADIRDASLAAWRMTLTVLAGVPGWLDTVVTQQLILEWYAIMMQPLGMAIDATTFYRPSMETAAGSAAPERHNVDKNMLAQDPSLITNEITLKARVAAATALAQLIVFWPVNAPSVEDIFQPMLMHYIDSSSMLQKFLTAVVSEEWAREHDAVPDVAPLIEKSVLAQTLSAKTLAWLQGTPPPAYHEMTLTLMRIHGDCVALLGSFASDCKLPMSSIPNLGTDIDVTGTKTGCFTIDVAQQAVGQIYTRLKDSLGRTKKRELGVIAEKRGKIVASIERYVDIKAQHDIRVSAAFAAAFVAFRSTPDKVSPVVKGIMNGIKNEDNVDLQTRSAVAVASFIEFCTRHNISQPPDKIVKNLCTFLCQDVEQTPTFAFMRKHTEGILSFQDAMKPATNGKEAVKDKDKIAEIAKPDEASKARLSRRGAGVAFDQLSAKFGPRLLDVIPNMWQFMAGGLISAFPPGAPSFESDDRIQKQFGQDVIDSLSVLEAVVPTFHPDLRPKLAETFPMMHTALTSRFAIIRQSAARCFATLCDVMTSEAMRYVIENIVPLLGDPLVLANRQGATELMYHVVQRLDIKALPYVIFMVVPVLGRMSDSDDDIRSTATNTFASLVKMVPLEAGLPDPPGFPEELLKRRQAERQFLTQLLDGSKVEEYKIPVQINAELRKYQQDGVNWLAFLAKYQLHGILCDDMGLGKTLQSICILSSKHFERAERYKETQSPDSVHLPSLIVCPPTLTGHWYYEVLKYAENLRPVLYTGNARERTKLLSKLKTHDVVITSYEVVRNDISQLEGHNWLYCILDEGHVIKNAKTKLTKAVKLIRAQHRLILSGTPIQNNVLELWSLFDFLMPGFLGTEASFNERFGKPILSNRDGKAKNGEAAALALEALHKQVLPFLLRRLKEDVLNDLPPKIIQDYYCELSELQKYLYDNFSKSQAHASAEQAVQSSSDDKPQQHIFQSLQYLRKLCNHPAFVLKDDKEAIRLALGKASSSPDDLHDIQHAPKLLALRQILTDCGIGGQANPTVDSGKSELIDTEPETRGAFSQHRVLIFCQMKQMLDIIETDLFNKHMPSVTYMRLDGSTDSSKRHAVVQTFNSDPSIDCLLLTTHIGGLGLTLTGADTVIFIEHDWNPMKDLQAMDRAHRIGQKKVVNVYRLITKGTLEEKIMGLQRFKVNIANSVVNQQNSGLASMDTDLVLDLFKRTSEEEDAAAAAKKKAKEASGPVSQKNLLQGLEELPAEDEYQGLDLSSFMGSLGR